jgi:hypothetical protein
VVDNMRAALQAPSVPVKVETVGTALDELRVRAWNALESGWHPPA